MSSQDTTEDINKVEYWRWTEEQGIELGSTEKPEKNLQTVEEEAQVSEKQVVMEEKMSNSNDNKEKKLDESNNKENHTKKQQQVVIEDEEKKPINSLAPVGFKELFRFADNLDYVLMVIGTLGAIVHGCSLPLFLRFFADLVNSFGANINHIDKMMDEVLKVIIIIIINIQFHQKKIYFDLI